MKNIILFFILFYGCAITENSQYSLTPPSLPCGDEIVWRLDLLEGFKNTAMTIIFENDTVCRFVELKDWSDLSVMACKDQNRFKLVIRKWSEILDTIYYDKIRTDSLFITVLANNSAVIMKDRIVKYKYITLGYNSGQQIFTGGRFDNSKYQNNFNISEAFYGDSVVWRIDFGSGFNTCPMTILNRGDTLFHFDSIAYPNFGKCSKLGIVHYKDEGISKLYVDNWPYFTAGGDAVQLGLDSMDLEINMCSYKYLIRHPISGDRFLRLNFDIESGLFSQKWFNKHTLCD